MQGYGVASQWTATLKVLTEETIQSSAIEGVVLDAENVRSSLAQKKVLNKLFGGFEGKLTREKWMKMTKASSRTALRDIEDLMNLGVIEQEGAGGTSTAYRRSFSEAKMESSPKT